MRETLHAFLAERQMLLVLDNFEHVIEASPVVAELLSSSPRLALLVTSRTPLRLRGEQEYLVPPLGLPTLTRLPMAREVESAPSVRLFVQRAQAVAPAFRLTQSNAATVAAICRRLDGLPLATELAAAKVKFLAPMALLTRLDKTLPMLVGGARDLPERQQTMRRAVGWSYDLLGETEQPLFRTLAVFVGGWTLEAAEAVASAGDVLDPLGRLVEQSLVAVESDADSGEFRHRMLEPVRQYALEQLDACGEGEQARRRHALYYLSFAQAAEPGLVGPEETEWLARLEADHDNLRAALDWSIRNRDASTGAGLGGALWRFWRARGHLTEGRRWLEGIIALSPSGPNMDPPLGVAAVDWTNLLHVTGLLAKDQGDYGRAVELFEASLALRRQVDNRLGIAASLHNLGIIAYEQGQHERALTMQEEALSIARELGSEFGVAYTLSTLGDVVRAQGDHERASMLLDESLGLFRRTGHSWGVALALTGLADTECALGNHRHAATLYKEALALQRSLGNGLGVANCLEGLAGVASAQGRPEWIALLGAAAASLREDTGGPLPMADRTSHGRTLDLARVELGDEAFEAMWVEGQAMGIHQAVELGLQTAELVER